MTTLTLVRSFNTLLGIVITPLLVEHCFSIEIQAVFIYKGSCPPHLHIHCGHHAAGSPVEYLHRVALLVQGCDCDPVRSVTPDPSWAVALTITVPAPVALSSPVGLIVADPVSGSTLHSTFLLVAFSGATTALNSNVSPALIAVTPPAGSTLMEVTLTSELPPEPPPPEPPPPELPPEPGAGPGSSSGTSTGSITGSGASGSGELPAKLRGHCPGSPPLRPG